MIFYQSFPKIIGKFQIIVLALTIKKKNRGFIRVMRQTVKILYKIVHPYFEFNKIIYKFNLLKIL